MRALHLCYQMLLVFLIIFGVLWFSFVFFVVQIRMWVLDEVYEGRKLSEWVNVLHENKKFLPGCKLPSNLRAVPCLKEACQGADLLVFALPHQFVEVCAHS